MNPFLSVLKVVMSSILWAAEGDILLMLSFVV